MYKKIKLTQNKYAIVDAEDFDRLNQFKWYARKDLNTFYAQRKELVDGDWKIVHMHRVVADTPDGMITDHINRNGLDNRKGNLRVCTHQENMLNMQKRKDNSSGHKNIYFSKRDQRWFYMIQRNKKQYWGPEFANIGDAINALSLLKKDLGV